MTYDIVALYTHDVTRRQCEVRRVCHAPRRRNSRAEKKTILTTQAQV